MAFAPVRDLTPLVDQEYFLSFFIRSTTDDLRLDVRFLDTDTGPDDHAWRKRYPLEFQLDGSESWQKVMIPLTAFEEQGAWEGEWFNPIGDFQWENTDRFEFSTEYRGYPEDTIWIDQVVVTNQDTASLISAMSHLPAHPYEIEIFPNPCASSVSIAHTGEYSPVSPTRVQIYDVSGKLHFAGLQERPLLTVDTASWMPGLYFLVVEHQPGIRLARTFVKK